MVYVEVDWITEDRGLRDYALNFFCRTPSTLFEYTRLALRRKTTIGELTASSINHVERYYRTISSNGKLKSYLHRNLKREPYQGQNFFTAHELYVLCRLVKPEVVIETGVASGYSSTFLLQALEDQDDGHLYSVDISRLGGSNMPPEREIGWLIPPWLRERWTFVLGASRNVLEPLLNGLGKVDIFYHDSEHTYSNMMFEFETALRYASRLSLILSDNINWNTSFPDFCRKHHLQARHIHSNLGGARVADDLHLPMTFLERQADNSVLRTLMT